MAPDDHRGLRPMNGTKVDPFVVAEDPTKKGYYHLIDGHHRFLLEIVDKRQETVWVRVAGEREPKHVHVSLILNRPKRLGTPRSL